MGEVLSIQGGETGDGSRGGASSSSSSLTSLRSLFVFLVALTKSVLPIVLLPRVLLFWETMTEAVVELEEDKE